MYLWDKKPKKRPLAAKDEEILHKKKATKKSVVKAPLLSHTSLHLKGQQPVILNEKENGLLNPSFPS